MIKVEVREYYLNTNVVICDLCFSLEKKTELSSVSALFCQTYQATCSLLARLQGVDYLKRGYVLYAISLGCDQQTLVILSPSVAHKVRFYEHLLALLF